MLYPLRALSFRPSCLPSYHFGFDFSALLCAVCCSKMQFYSCQGNLTPSAKMPKPYIAMPPAHMPRPSCHVVPASTFRPSLVFCLRCASFWLTIKCQDILFFHSIVFFYIYFFVLGRKGVRHLQQTIFPFFPFLCCIMHCVQSVNKRKKAKNGQQNDYKIEALSQYRKNKNFGSEKHTPPPHL